jgi:hypothetical protein
MAQSPWESRGFFFRIPERGLQARPLRLVCALIHFQLTDNSALPRKGRGWNGMEQQKLWIEPVGQIIVVRVRGEVTEEMLTEMHERVLQLIQDTGQPRILYDALETDAPSVDALLLQQRHERESRARLGGIALHKAILVPNTRMAYLARIAFGEFGEGEYRVFYNDLAQAVRWLES